MGLDSAREVFGEYITRVLPGDEVDQGRGEPIQITRWLGGPHQLLWRPVPVSADRR